MYGTNQMFLISYSRSPIMGIKWWQRCIEPVYFTQIIKEAVRFDQAPFFLQTLGSIIKNHGEPFAYSRINSRYTPDIFVSL